MFIMAFKARPKPELAAQNVGPFVRQSHYYRSIMFKKILVPPMVAPV
jgi:hypothetical protein